RVADAEGLGERGGQHLSAPRSGEQFDRWTDRRRGTARDTEDQRGAIRMAPSRRIVSPLIIGLATTCATRAAYSAGSPRREGCGTCAPSEACASSGSEPSSGVLNSPGAMVFTRICREARSRAIGRVIPTTPPFDAE